MDRWLESSRRSRPDASESRIDVNTFVLALSEETPLLSWMQKPGQSCLLPHVDRVIVHVEQISVKNRFEKKLGVDLGRALQRQTPDVEKCVVKMSQPHIHRGSGPMFKLGGGIVAACDLRESAIYSLGKRTAAESDNGAEYRRKRKMSSEIFRFVVEADEVQQGEMQLEVDGELQKQWRAKISSGEAT